MKKTNIDVPNMESWCQIHDDDKYHTHNSIFVKINFIFFITFIQLGSSFDDIQELASLRHLESEVRGRSQEMARKGSKDLSPPQNEIYLLYNHFQMAGTFV